MDEMILTPAEKMEQVVERLTRERDEARELIDVEKKQHLITKHCYDDLVDEVARLEGLILDCGDDAPGSAGKLNREAHRIRAQREEEQHRKHPTGDYCVYCLSQWPCVEAGEQ